MDTPATSRRCPPSSPLNTEARKPTASLESISSLRARQRPALGSHPPPTKRSCFTQLCGTGREGVISKENSPPPPKAPPPPPPAFSTKAKVSLVPRPSPKSGKRVWCSERLFLSHGVGSNGIKNVIIAFPQALHAA